MHLLRKWSDLRLACWQSAHEMGPRFGTVDLSRLLFENGDFLITDLITRASSVEFNSSRRLSSAMDISGFIEVNV